MIVGLTGRIGAGKDTAAVALLNDGFERRSFADLLRDFAYRLDCYVMGDVRPVRVTSLVDEHGWEHAKRAYPDVRRLLQRLGTNAGREVLGEDVWVCAAMATLDPERDYVFTDVRFPNEADAVRAAGGIVVCVVNSDLAPVGDGSHVSETAMAQYAVDYVIHNKPVRDAPESVQQALTNVVAYHNEQESAA